MRRASWKEVHGELTRLARSKGAYDADEARWLLEGKRVRVHDQLGYGSYLSYLEHVFGYGPRLASPLCQRSCRLHLPNGSGGRERRCA